jgi:photosystem II stability/assembly factor-like uncharacterized protein
MVQMRLAVLLIAVVSLLGACSSPPPAAISSSAPPTPTATTLATLTASPTATASATPIALPNTTQLSAPSAGVVWALVAGSRLFRSTDRGDTWQERSVALDPVAFGREISFISEREGWSATTGSPGTACSSQWTGIAHTVDGGATWEQLVPQAAPTSGNPSGLFGGPCKNGLTFADAQHGYLSSSDPNGAPVIYRSADGGRTWSASRPLPDPPGFTTRGGGDVLHPGRVRAFDGVLLVTAVGAVGGQSVGYVFRSLDGGGSWTYASRVPDAGGTVAFVTAARWIEIGPPSSSKQTADGGATWQSYTTDYSQAAPIAPDIVFGDANVGYATVRGAIQRTIDGGAHWTALRTPGT